MRRKKENIVRYTAAELDAIEAAGKTHTNWTTAAAEPVPDGSNPDDAMERIEWATTELPAPKRKEHTRICELTPMSWSSFAGRDVAIRPGSTPSFALMSSRSGASRTELRLSGFDLFAVRNRAP